MASLLSALPIPKHTRSSKHDHNVAETSFIQSSKYYGRALEAMSGQQRSTQHDTLDFIVRQQQEQHTGKLMPHARYSDMMEKHVNEEQLKRPLREEEEETTRKTAETLNRIVEQKVAASRPTYTNMQTRDVQFLKYTPANASGESKTRVIRVQEAAIDPLEPPKFRIKKLPQAPPSPPVPIMHSPTRKIAAEDAEKWRIPPCISNWKNAKGYTIALDKRLAADGRSLLDVSINDKFAKLSESLFVAERSARDEIEQRARILNKLERKKKEEKEEELRMLAQRARDGLAFAVKREAAQTPNFNDTAYKSDSENSDLEGGVEQRNQIRRERAKEIERQQRQEARRQERVTVRNAERDVSEKIALGQNLAPNKDTLFDQRLFNRAETAAAGFGAEDSYNLYDKPLFTGSSMTLLHRAKPSEHEDEPTDTSKTKVPKPDRGFQGTSHPNVPRSQPVQFEKGATDVIGETEVKSIDADPFGVNTLFASSSHKSSSQSHSPEIQTSGLFASATAPGPTMHPSRQNRLQNTSPYRSARSPSSTEFKRLPNQRERSGYRSRLSRSRSPGYNHDYKRRRR